PGRCLASTSAWRAHLGSVSADPIPSRLATATMAGQSNGYSGRTSATIRTPRSRSSGGEVAEPRTPTPPFSHEMEPPNRPGRFNYGSGVVRVGLEGEANMLGRGEHGCACLTFLTVSPEA